MNKHDTNPKPNFALLLEEAPTEVNRPKNLPTGTYTFVVGRWEEGVSSKKHTPFVKFEMRPIAAGDDVDDDELEEALTSADGTRNELKSKTMPITFYLTPDAVYRLDEFHQHCGIDLEQAVSRGLRNDEVQNSQVDGFVGPRQQENPDAPVFMEIKRTLPTS